MPAKRTKKKTKKKFYLPYIIAIVVIIGLLILIFSRSGSEGPFAFNTRIPANYTVFGIDVSRYQEKINWKTVAQTRGGNDSIAISFAFIKATEGKSLKDNRYAYNWKHAKKQGILRGAYHYYKPNVNSKLQADNFIATVKMEKGDLPPVLDIEETGKYGDDNMRKGIKNWLTIVEKHYGIKPIIYCYVDFYERFLCTDDFKDYPFWIAHYYKDKLRVKEKWYFWQHSDKAEVDGIKAKVDFNVFNGTIDELKKLCKQ